MEWKINKAEAVILILMIISLGLYFYTQYNYRNIDKHKKYVLAIITRKNVGKNGAFYEYRFSFRQQTFASHFFGLGLGYKVNDLVLVKVQNDKPVIHMALPEYQVPGDFKIENVPDSGWDILPKDFQLKQE